MDNFEKAEFEWADSHVQNINEIYDRIKSVSPQSNFKRSDARDLYHSMLKDEVFINSKYQVIVRKVIPNDVDPLNRKVNTDVYFTHLSIKRIDKQPIKDWREMQQIKNMILGDEVEAVELYPAESRKVDAANQYHMWALPKGEKFNFGFDEGRLTSEYEDDKIKQREGA
jgi:hypothetical protein